MRDIVEDYLTVQQVATSLQISPRRVYQLCKTKGFPAIRIGTGKNSIRIDRGGLEKWIDQHRRTITGD